MAHFNWVGYIFNVDHHYVHVATAIFVTGLLFLVGLRARMVLGTGEKAIVPASKFSVRGFFELVTETTYSVSELILGKKEGPKYVPLAAAVFLYVLINNFIGLVPGMTPATDNMNTTLAIGIFSFLYYNYVGLKSDPRSYLMHFLGPVWWLAWLMLPLELISHALRPLTLGIRLRGNILADHTVLGAIHELVGYIVPVPFYMMGVIVCFMQAFVFALLTLVYILLAQPHDDH